MESTDVLSKEDWRGILYRLRFGATPVRYRKIMVAEIGRVGWSQW